MIRKYLNAVACVLACVLVLCVNSVSPTFANTAMDIDLPSKSERATYCVILAQPDTAATSADAVAVVQVQALYSLEYTSTSATRKHEWRNIGGKFRLTKPNKRRCVQHYSSDANFTHSNFLDQIRLVIDGSVACEFYSPGYHDRTIWIENRQDNASKPWRC